MPDWKRAKCLDRNGVTVLCATVEGVSSEPGLVLLPTTFDMLENGATGEQVTFARSIFAIKTDEGIPAITRIEISGTEVRLYLDLAAESVNVECQLSALLAQS